ncbi:MAG: hypothetical protein GOVbin1807_172 [Prokaryotic dsDNA virus sp.]|nr:MAG: hypothetical protein GOVbin1807_172 [Prokaryotic dsDNA virus sp.]|tara:strand:- start:1043 stop:2152 length:1110 start_codon:yes stop_codon:yes gene_type:complete
MSCKIHNNSDYDISEMKPLIRNLYGFAKDRFGFKKPPSIDFVSDQTNHPMLGKTAHYEPTSMKITIYTDGRHPKDMMRSIAHELVHHMQNENGHFDDEMMTQMGYAQKDPHLRKMEEEAYLEGNMCFRDWEDQYKTKNKDIFYERRIRKMSTKKWKNKELNGLLNERWGFSMNLDKLNEGSKKKKPDEDGDGVPDWADKKPGKDDHEEEKEEKEEEVNEINMKNALSGDTDETPMSDLEAQEEAPNTLQNAPKENLDALIAAVKDAGTQQQVDELAEMIKAYLSTLTPSPEDVQEAADLSIGDVSEKQAKIRTAIIMAIKKATGLTLKPENVSDVVDTVLAAVQGYSTTRQAAVKHLAQTPSKEKTNEN